MKILPPYLFGSILTDITSATIIRFFMKFDNDLPLHDFKLNGRNLFFIGFDTVFFLTLVAIIEINTSKKKSQVNNDKGVNIFN